MLRPYAAARSSEAPPLRVVVEQAGDLARDGPGVSPRDEDAAPVGEELLRVRIRRRDDGLSGADRVRERARRDLLRLEVGRDVDIGAGEKFGELTVAHEAVVEDHARRDAEALRAALEHEPIRLAVLLSHVRVRRAEHDVDGVRVSREDRGQRVDHVLDPLVRGEQSERQDDRLPFDAELVLAPARARHVRDPVGDMVDLVMRDAVDALREDRRRARSSRRCARTASRARP